jgi:TolA-binding protein
LFPDAFVPSAVCAQADECELLNEQHEQLQGVSLEAQQLRDQVQQLRQATADLPALRDELQELQVLLTTRQQLQQEAQDADQLRQQVEALREAQVDLAALRQELQQLQATHDEAIKHVQELKLKVGGVKTAPVISCLGLSA